VCVCVRARARARVCVCARARARVEIAWEHSLITTDIMQFWMQQRITIYNRNSLAYLWLLSIYFESVQCV